MRVLLREPLFHFVVLGTVLFVVDSLLGESDAYPNLRIDVTTEDIRHLGNLWQRTWSRPPSEEELRGLIEQHIREEVLYREAVALDLDRDDTIVRRRLVQKLEFLSEDLTNPETLTDAELQTWHQVHSDDYRDPERLSFVQVYFSRDRRGEAAREDAAQALLALTEAGASSVKAGRELGDPSLLQYDYVEQSPADVARHLGAAFAEAVTDLPAGGWRGPVESSLGIHLVYIVSRKESRLRTLDEVRERVRTDLARDRRKQANRAFYEKLRARYQISVDDEELMGTGE